MIKIEKFLKKWNEKDYGNISNMQEDINVMSNNFGGWDSRKVPNCVLFPRETRHVQNILMTAYKLDIPIAVRGIGHCAGSQSLTKGGIIISTKKMNTILDFDQSAKLVTVQPGCCWSSLLDFVTQNGLTYPIITDWLKLTIGGTLSAGGIGSQSFRYGIQTDHVSNLEIVLTNGEIINCSLNQYQDIFYAALNGFGQYGVITKCMLNLIKSPKRVKLIHSFYRNFSDFFENTNSLSDYSDIDGLIAHAFPTKKEDFYVKHPKKEIIIINTNDNLFEENWLYDLEITCYYNDQSDGNRFIRNVPQRLKSSAYREQDLSYNDYIYRIPPILEQEQQKGIKAHPEIILFIPDSEAKKIIQNYLYYTKSSDIGDGTLLFIPMNSQKIVSKNFICPKGDKFWMFAVLAICDHGDKIKQNKIFANHKDLYSKARKIGAFHYLCDSNIWHKKNFGLSHYGDKWNDLQNIKKYTDPTFILNKSLNLFKRGR